MKVDISYNTEYWRKTVMGKYHMEHRYGECTEVDIIGDQYVVIWTGADWFRMDPSASGVET